MEDHNNTLRWVCHPSSRPSWTDSECNKNGCITCLIIRCACPFLLCSAYVRQLGHVLEIFFALFSFNRFLLAETIFIKTTQGHPKKRHGPIMTYDQRLMTAMAIFVSLSWYADTSVENCKFFILAYDPTDGTVRILQKFLLQTKGADLTDGHSCSGRRGPWEAGPWRPPGLGGPGRLNFGLQLQSPDWNLNWIYDLFKL